MPVGMLDDRLKTCPTMDDRLKTCPTMDDRLKTYPTMDDRLKTYPTGNYSRAVGVIFIGTVFSPRWTTISTSSPIFNASIAYV